MRLRLPPMQQALCVCVSKTDPLANVPSRHPVTTPSSLSALGTQIHSVRSGGVQRRLHAFHLENSALPMDSQGCGLCIYLESSARLPQKALRDTRDLTKEINRIHSSLAGNRISFYNISNCISPCWDASSSSLGKPSFY